MDKKKYLIEKITKFDNKYFNEDQKRIAISILENSPEKEVQAYADFIFMKRRTGFAFDYSPEIAKGRLITLKEDVKKRINVGRDVSEDENKLIIGDNYNALKSLLVTHKEKIDVIYIDPPYNTESAKTDGNQSSKEGESSKFIYKDKFGRGGWLNMMKERLTLAKDLLSPDGVIFVSIDDQEQAYLKVLMDDIFGEDRFISNMPRPTSIQNKNNIKTIASSHDYVLVYSKLNQFNKRKFDIDEKEYKYEDEKGRYKQNRNTVSKNGTNTWPILIKGVEYYPVYGKNGDKKGSWNFSIEKKNELILNDGFIINGNKLYTKTYENSFRPYRSVDLIDTFFDKFLSKTTPFGSVKGTNELTALGLEFDQPKSTDLIKELLRMHPKKKLTILDFFAGSGTTGHAVMELNKEDNGIRKFILVTNNQNNIGFDITYERLHIIIKGETSKGKKDFDWIKKNKPYSNEKLRVININDDIKISLDQEIDPTLYKEAKNGLKLLDVKYNKENLNLYYDLAALNPLENKEDKFNK